MLCQAETLAGSPAGMDTDAVPDGWERVERDELHYEEYQAWEHAITGLRVSVRRSAIPDQMHDARTSTLDVGYVARVRGEYGANLSRELGQRSEAFDAAFRFMRAYPHGEFDVPAPFERGTRRVIDPIEWEGR